MIPKFETIDVGDEEHSVLVEIPVPTEEFRKEVNDLLNWGIKNGFIDEDVENWTWDKKVEFYRRCP